MGQNEQLINFPFGVACPFIFAGRMPSIPNLLKVRSSTIPARGTVSFSYAIRQMNGIHHVGIVKSTSPDAGSTCCFSPWQETNFWQKQVVRNEDHPGLAF